MADKICDMFCKVAPLQQSSSGEHIGGAIGRAGGIGSDAAAVAGSIGEGVVLVPLD